MAVDQDYFIPVRDPAQPSPIETLPGAQNLGEIADIEYIQKKMLDNFLEKAFNGSAGKLIMQALGNKKTSKN